MQVEKHQILDEIKRIATANSGVPPGSRRFQTETGVPKRAWLGVYWAKWSDALAEAGFEPNVKTSGYADSYLLRVLADYIRDIQRFPSDSELRLRRTEVPDFPSDKVFRRFGGKTRIVEALTEWCERNPDYGDVNDICKIHYGNEIVAKPASPRENPGVLGYVYLVKSGHHYKIGHTNALGRREYELKLQLPEKISTVHVISTDDPQGIEAYWHKRFADKRQNGEWFALTSSDISAFRRRKFM